MRYSNVMQLLFQCSLVLCLLHAGTAQADGNVRPVTPEAQRLFKYLDNTQMSQQLETAEYLHRTQLTLLEGVTAGNEDRHRTFVEAVRLALDEYYALELSFPQHVEKLVETGCLLDEWSSLGLIVENYSYSLVSAESNSLVYIPQPIGLAQLRPIPGLGCTFNRRCFDEYCLALRQDQLETWNISVMDSVSWMKPFNELNFTEVVHTLVDNPLETHCKLDL